MPFLSGNEAVALAANHVNVNLATGYPGTPSTEIVENFARLGGHSQWAPNEKVALEVGLGAAFAKARALVTMKHVGLNVAADVLFTATYTGVTGGLVIVSADDPGMASSQNEQDNRHFASAAGAPMLEPANSQEAYEYTIEAFRISERWNIPVMLRMTTRVCHSKTIVTPFDSVELEKPDPTFVRDIPSLVMIPAYARPAHKRMRTKLAEIKEYGEDHEFNRVIEGEKSLGIITSGITFVHAKEAAPEASYLKLGLTHPVPMEKIRSFADSVDRLIVIEEGDFVLTDAIRAAGIMVETKQEMYRYGELNVDRVRRILTGDESEERKPPAGKPPQLCPGCSHTPVFETLGELDLIVSGDIGCYTLGVMPPYIAMDTCVCMGASIGIGLGMRRVLPEEQAKRVVSVIGDSTFVHSGLTGIAEMVYNRPDTGHVVLILDNGITAMTGMQEHAGTGRMLDHSLAPSEKVSFEDTCKAMGVDQVEVIDPIKDKELLEVTLKAMLESQKLCVLIARKPCILSIGTITKSQKKSA